MSKRLNLVRKSVKQPTSTKAYALELEIRSSEGISPYVFVKQRTIDATQHITDTFVAIASPAQLEDFSTIAPAKGSSYFRDRKVAIVGESAQYIEDIFKDILIELQRLVDDVEILEDLEGDGLYTITSEGITANIQSMHTHYRLPLVAQPAGQNGVDVNEQHFVENQNPELPGWLNTAPGDPAGAKFKYNIAKDQSLAALWPIPDNYLPVAHLEVNGLTLSGTSVLITGTGIYWYGNSLGAAPWPEDYVSPTNTGSIVHQVKLVLDFIV